MRAGIVYIKVPIASIKAELPDEDVSALKESIVRYGLLQPVGIVRSDTGYRLIFGKRRLKACTELQQKYIHAVQLSFREDEEKLVSFSENLHRKEDVFLKDAALSFKGSDIRTLLCLDETQMKFISCFLRLEEEYKSFVNSENAKYVTLSDGNGRHFKRMCDLESNLPMAAKDKVRLSVLSDRRIFLNEIEKILELMRLGGYSDTFYEEKDRIIIKKMNAG